MAQAQKAKKSKSTSRSKVKSKAKVSKKTKSVKKTVTKKASSKKASSKKTAATKTSAKKAVKKTAAKKATNKKTAAAKPKGHIYPSQVKIGSMVPAFQAQSTQGEVDLKKLKGKKVVLYFYPKDHTSGCTVEGHDFSNAIELFKSQNAVVYGVSRDSLKSHQSFIEKQSYKIDLISDPEEKLCAIFGVMKEKSLYGRKYIGVDRSTFIIDESGKLIYEWRNVKVPGHVEEVLKAIQK